MMARKTLGQREQEIEVIIHSFRKKTIKSLNLYKNTKASSISVFTFVKMKNNTTIICYIDIIKTTEAASAQRNSIII